MKGYEQMNFHLLSLLNSALVMLFYVIKHYKSNVKVVAVHQKVLFFTFCENKIQK